MQQGHNQEADDNSVKRIVPLQQEPVVITSYSIHYTKLYDQGSVDRKFGIERSLPRYARYRPADRGGAGTRAAANRAAAGAPGRSPVLV